MQNLNSICLRGADSHGFRFASAQMASWGETKTAWLVDYSTIAAIDSVGTFQAKKPPTHSASISRGNYTGRPTGQMQASSMVKQACESFLDTL